MQVTKSKIQKELGFEISDEQFEHSRERAEQKLKSIVSRFGDCGGNRRKPDYLIELICEDAIANAFSELTLLTTMLNMEKGTQQIVGVPLVTDHIVTQVCE